MNRFYLFIIIGIYSITFVLGCSNQSENQISYAAKSPTLMSENTQALQTSTQLCDFSVYSKTSSNLRDRVTATNGYIGSAGTSEIGIDAIVTGDLESAGGILLRDRARVNGNLTTGDHVNRQTGTVVTGTIDENATLTTFVIPTNTISTGTQDVYVYSGQTNNLSPGKYDEVVAYGGSTLRLSSGLYQIRRFVVESSSAQLKVNIAQGAVDVNVQEELRFGDRMSMALEGGTDAKLVRFYSNYTGQVALGTDSIFYGTVTAPNAEIYAFSRMDIHGALYGKTVVVDTDIHFYGIGCEDLCAGIQCNTPPADFCVDSGTLRDYSAEGSCSRGVCEYSYFDLTCEYGCENGTCKQAECTFGECCDNGHIKDVGQVCRASAGVCDVAETCDGASVECPLDEFASASTECRESAGICDIAETCSGASAACPSDEFASASTECRESAWICDVAETCDGASAVCPVDEFASANTECRVSAGVCDVAETCDGASAVCPSDIFASASIECRASVGICDVAETCSGSSAECPLDELASVSYDNVKSDFIFTLPFGVDLEDACFTTSEAMRIADGVSIAGTNATISNLGQGKISVGPDSSLGGNMYAIGDVTLGDRSVVQGKAYVNGNIDTSGTGDAGRVAGGIGNTKVKHGSVYDWTIYRQSSNVEKKLPADAPPTEIPPGSYKSLKVQPRATLVLTAGTYYFETITIEAEANVVINGNGSPVILFVRDSLISRGQYTHSTTPADFFIGYAGQETAIFDSPFSGTVVAPNAEIRLAPLNGLKHEGSFFGLRINAEAHTEIVFTPFGHWDKILDTDRCSSETTIRNCAEIATWEQRDYVLGETVQDGTFVYAVHTENAAGLGECYQPGEGALWREAWNRIGYCSTVEGTQDFIGNYGKDKLLLFYPFGKIHEGQSGRYIEDISGNKAVVEGDNVFVVPNAGRVGCNTFNALSLNVDVDPFNGGDELENQSHVIVDKQSESKSISVILSVKPATEGSHTFVSNINPLGGSFSFGYSAGNGLYVKIGENGAFQYVGLENDGDLEAGVWTELAVIVESLGDGTSRVQLLKNGSVLFGDEGVVVNGEVSLSDGQWVFGAYLDSATGEVHTPMEGLLGPLLIFDKTIPTVLVSGIYAYAMEQSLTDDVTSTAGTEPDIRTAAPQLPVPNPLSFLKNIEPPKANTQGTAEVVYPLDIPKADIGPTPEVHLTYSSARKKGNAGIGWNLSVSTIEIDTRDKGVPTYTDSGPIDNLLLDGQKLVYWKTDSPSGDHLYRLKRESSFLVARQSTDPKTFFVYYPDGRIDLYGTRLASPDNPNHVFRWYLDTSTDKNGNYVDYFWDTYEYTPEESQKYSHMAVVPRLYRIVYSRSNIDANGREIWFDWYEKHNFPEFPANGRYFDVSGRSGFLVFDPNLLQSITFLNDLGDVIKSINTFYHSDGTLYFLNEYNGNSECINTHAFFYTTTGYDYPIDGPPTDLGDENRFFKPAVPAHFPSDGDFMRSRSVSKTMYNRDPAFISNAMESGPMDWNGDGVIDNVNLSADDAPKYTLGRGNYPAFGSYVSGANQGVPVSNLFTLVEEDPSCLYPINHASGDNLRVPYELSQSYMDQAWNFKRSGLYDLNGDGTKDFIGVCNDKYLVAYNINGNINFGTADIQYFPSSPPNLYLNDYNLEDNGRTDDNAFIEYNSLEIRQAERIGFDGYNYSLTHTRVVDKFLDFNGDGKLDRIYAEPAVNSERQWPGAEIFVVVNKGPLVGIDDWLIYEGFLPSAIALEYIEGSSGVLNDYDDDLPPNFFTRECERQRMVDINGDGLPDIMQVDADASNRRAVTYLNDGSYRDSYFWMDNMPVYPNPNGDLVEGLCIRTSGNSEDIGLTPNSWPTVPGLPGDDIPIFDPNTGGKWRLDTYQLSDMVDMNGDGLPDMVRASEEGLLVALNEGASFRDEFKWADLDLPYIGYDRIICDPKTNDNGNITEINCENTNGSLLQDCSGDWLPDLLSVSNDGNEWFCRENTSGMAQRLRVIKDFITERSITLKYKDDNPVVYVNPTVEFQNYKTRSVLAAVEISYGEDAPIPVEKRSYSYTKGVEDESKNRFLGWEEIHTKVFPSKARDVFYFEYLTYDFSDTEGLDEWGLHPVPDEHLNGLLLQKKTGYLQPDKPGEEEQRLLNVTNFEYATVPVLSDVDEIQYVYPNKVSKSAYDLEGNCLNPPLENGDCPSVEDITITRVYMDTTNGMILERIISSYGDSTATFDDIDTKQVFSPVGDEFRSYLVAQETSKGDKKEYVEYGYNNNGNLVSETRWDASEDGSNADRRIEFTYDEEGAIETITYPGDQVVQYQHLYGYYEGSAYTQKAVLPNGTELEKSYDYNGRLVSEINENQIRTEYKYDNIGRLSAITNTLATEEYGEAEDLIQFTYFDDSWANQSWFTYFGVKAEGLQHGVPILLYNFIDSAGRNAQTRRRLDVDGETKWVVSGKIEYDELGQIEKNGKRTVYDDASELGYFENEMVSPETYQYDVLGNIKKVTYSDGTFENYEYAIVKNWTEDSPNRSVDVNLTLHMTKVTSSENEEARVYRQPNGNVIGTVQMGADGNKQITNKEIRSPYEYAEVDPLGRVSEQEIDSLGRIEWSSTPDEGRVEYSYNEMGLPSKIVQLGRDGTGVSRETSIYYDELGRPQFIDYQGEGRDITYTYFSNEADDVWDRNQVQSLEVGTFSNGNIQDVDLVTEYDYGINSVRKTRTLNIPEDGGAHEVKAEMQYVYDPYGRTTQVLYPDNEIVNYAYDNGGRLFSITGESLTGENRYINKTHYNQYGQQTLVENGNGIVKEYAYDDVTDLLNTISVDKITGGTPENLMTHSYQYNPRKLINQIESENEYRLTYAYDDLGRLSNAYALAPDSSSWYRLNTYQFDVGNRMVEASGVGYTEDISYLPDQAWPSEFVKTEVVLGNDVTTNRFSFNPWGEMENSQTLVNDEEVSARSFTFNGDGTLGAIEDTGLKVDFKYDAENNRVYKKSVDGDGVKKESLSLFALYTEKDDTMSNHISDGSLVIATKVAGNDDKVLYPVANHLGSTIMTTDNQGEVLSKTVYDPFGNVWSLNNNDDTEKDDTQQQDRQFTNQVYDKETGLYYFNMRYYDPQLGMFISPDPAMSGFNHYAYASGNPIHFSDPSGLVAVGVDVDLDDVNLCDGACFEPGPGVGNYNPLGADEVGDYWWVNYSNPDDVKEYVYGVNLNFEGQYADYYIGLSEMNSDYMGDNGFSIVPGLEIVGSMASTTIATLRDDPLFWSYYMSNPQSIGAGIAYLFGKAFETYEGLIAARGFELAPRVAQQLSDPRLGRLAGILTPERLNQLANNPEARRFLDARTGNINVIQDVEGILLRITTPRDAMRIISVGPIKERNIINSIENGNFILLP